MSLKEKIEDEDYYCLVQCGCGRKFKPEEMYLCEVCNKIKCNFCLITECLIFQCKGFCNEDSNISKKSILTCGKCLECPLCFTPLIKKLNNKKYYLFCNSCYWISNNVHISKEQKEDLEKYIKYLNQEKNSGFFKGMYDNISSQLTKDNSFVGEKGAIQDELMKYVNEINTVQKAMEKTEQNFEEFDKKIKGELNKKEKQFSDKYEYNDDYLNEENKENKNNNFKLKSKLLSCYNDFTQNFNTLDEVKKAFNSHILNLPTTTSLEQRHNNPIFQNNSIFNQYPKFIDLIPQQRNYIKKCKECETILVKIPENPQEKSDKIGHYYLVSLPIILINKIDWEKSILTLKFVLVNIINVTISFEKDPSNMTKIILPEGKFLVEEKNGVKKKLIDFKFDEKYKSDFVKNHMYIFRFILKAEYKKNDVGELTSIEYPVEIKFK